MADFQYINTQGQTQTVQAPDANTALTSAKDIAKDSGVMPAPATSPPATSTPTNAPVAPTPVPIQNPVTAPNPQTIGTPAPTLPTPTAPAANETYVAGMTQDLANTKTAVQDAYQTQIDSIDKQTQASQQKIQDLTTLQQNGVLDNIDTLSQPFRQALETSQRDALHINDNFEANQKLTNELDSLLTQGNQLIQQQKDQGGLSSIAGANLNKTISDVNARAGVISAVMAAHDKQISVAENMIDRTAAAITADRQDQLSYYKTLYDFYQGQKDDQGKQLLSLDAEKKTFLTAQIGMLQDDLKRSQDSVDYIKKLMTDPQTALTVAKAGVTLNDTPEQINQKLATQGAIEAKSKIIDDMGLKGYQYLATPGQIAGKPATQLATMRDAEGNLMTFWNPANTTSEIAGGKAAAGAGGTGGTATGGTAATTGILAMDAEAVLSGRNTLFNIRQTMGRSNSAAAYMQNLRAAITHVDPNFDFVASDAGGKAVSAPYFQKSVAAIDSVLPNINKIVDLSNQVSRVGVTGVDALLQKGAITIGNQQVSNFHQAQKLIADEIGIALGAGGVSDMKLQLGFDVTDPSVSQQVFASNMQLVKQFVENRKQGLEDLRYHSSTSGGPGVNTSTIDSDIQSAIKDPAHFATREDLISALVTHYGISQDQASEKVYSQWTDNTKR